MWNYAILHLHREKVASSTTLSFPKADIAEKILHVKALVDEILIEKDRYNFVTSQQPMAESWPIEVVGRDRDRDILVSKLLGSIEEPRIQVLSIVGEGGLGKTALAQLVYNDSRVEKSFDLRIWVSVSDSFDLVVFAQGILQSIKKM
ncbi:hypothetical protein ACS0TY_033577 [Phlomoides rotata]